MLALVWYVVRLDDAAADARADAGARRSHCGARLRTVAAPELSANATPFTGPDAATERSADAPPVADAHAATFVEADEAPDASADPTSFVEADAAANAEA